MTRVSKWWKCDLQVATPGGGFNLGTTAKHDDPAGRKKLAELYVSKLVSLGIDVIALADHNGATWISEMQAAGRGAGVTVFPGMEITTGTGSDGVHLILIGDETCTSADFEAILFGPCGFTRDGKHPLFNPSKVGEPLPAPRSLTDILDHLPEGFLVIAPHALTDNGIANQRSAKGPIRWKALHHDRLNALDVGDPRKAPGDSAGFNAKFRARELDDFPCLKRLAFVSTSDSYSSDDLGSQFTWMRMAEPSLEALRQAFLDHEARILCDWHDRVTTSPDPNDVRHAWIETLRLVNVRNSTSSIELEFDPHLNVIIGGRGSGKSTIVAGLRQLYSTIDGLPSSVQSDAHQFVEYAFADAELSASHRLPISQEDQQANWTSADGQRTERGGQLTATEFPVRVINQKELFERAASNPKDQFAASRNLLNLIDESLGVTPEDRRPSSFSARQAVARENWMRESIALRRIRTSLDVRELVQARLKELEAQLSAFDSPDARARRGRNELLHEQQQVLQGQMATVSTWLVQLMELVNRYRAVDQPTTEIDGEAEPAPSELQYREHFGKLQDLVEETARSLLAVVDRALVSVNEILEEHRHGDWADAVVAAEADSVAYQAELEAKGVSPSDYSAIRDNLAQQRSTLKELDLIESGLTTQVQAESQSWTDLLSVHEDLTKRRRNMLDEVAKRSGMLRFELLPNGDATGWVGEVRDLGGFRTDAFLEDVPRIAQWLWVDGSDEERTQRLGLWRNCLTSGGMGPIREQVDIKGNFQQRLEGLDETIRVRIAATLADDVVTMAFLRDGGNRALASNWQPVTEGSPGQRSAAMLSFVLHHGSEPLVLDQPEDDLDTDWISQLIVRELRTSRWSRQLIVVTHNANIPVNGDADRVIVMENIGGNIAVRRTRSEFPDGSEVDVIHTGPIELPAVRTDIQNIMEGGIIAFVNRERKYNNELSTYRAALKPEPITDEG